MDAIGIVGLFVGLLALDLAALRWGVNSTDKPDSAEWQRRRDWYARLNDRKGSGKMLPDIWLWAEAEHKHRTMHQEADRDRLARQLPAAAGPLRATLASTLRSLADRLDSSAPRVAEQRHRFAG